MKRPAEWPSKQFGDANTKPEAADRIYLQQNPKIRICPDRAPIAIRKPISRIRSVTLTNMMFMTPIPPTTNDTPATQAISARLRTEK